MTETCETTHSTQGMLQEFTSTGSKIAWHRDIIEGLHNNKGVPKVCGVFISDICQHSCAFCSTANRGRDVLDFSKIKTFLNQLIPLGLKAVILSGGGNPILYKCKESGSDFNDVVEWIHGNGLQVGLITNGMKMKTYPDGRKSWVTVKPETLDRLTWVRISLSGWDHGEEIEVPDINPEFTSLGGSWVYHDQYLEPLDRHGKVSRPEDLQTPLLPGEEATRIKWGRDRLPEIKERFRELLKNHPFTYIRTLPNCYQPNLIPERCKELEQISFDVDPRIIVQYKPPSPHDVCLLGYAHPVIWPNGGVTACDSVTLNPLAKRSQGGDIYEIAQWDTIGEIYKNPIKSLIDPHKWCTGCVFGSQNRLLDAVWKGADPKPEGNMPLHVNFI